MSGAALVPGDTLIARRVRCRSASADRGRVAGALERLDRATGLPAASILAVRRVQATVTGDPPRVEGVDLRAVARQAHRARAAPPPLDSEAVVFADEAELLACLAADVAAARPLGWWWEALLGRHVVTDAPDRSAVVVRAFARYARSLPAAAASSPRVMVAAGCLLREAELLDIAADAAEAHAAPLLARAWRDASRLRHPASPPPSDAHRRDRSAIPAGTSRPRLAGSEARHRWVARVVDDLAQLHVDPITARSAVRAEQVRRDLESSGDDDHGTAAPRRRPSASERPIPPDAAGTTSEEDAHAGASPLPDTVPPADEARPDAEKPPGDTIRTSLGGAFYLLNLLGHLDLPRSAAGPGEPGPVLSRWHVLALVLRTWDLEPADPLLPVLDQLAGELPDDDGPWNYRRPPASARWLPAPAQPWTWQAVGGRLILDDPTTGTILADVAVPDGRSPADVAREEAERAWPAGTPAAHPMAAPDPVAATHPAHRPSPPGVERWAHAVTGLVDVLLTGVGLDARMAQVPGSVAVSDVAVDVRLALDDVDLPVRRSGLDRDPGWEPDLGRIVRVEFQ